MATAKDAIFYAIPASIAVVAGVLAYRAWKERPWEPPKDSPELLALSPCGAGHYRCKDGKVQVTTGDERDSAIDRCVFRDLAPCKRACASDGIVLAGVDDGTAKVQLCDAPRNVGTLIGEERSYLEAPVAEAGTCEGDGFIPTPDRIEQCILKSSKDPNAVGVVFGHIKCKLGMVPTADRRPRLVPREAAVAVWCRRDPDAGVDDEVDAADAASDAATDASDGG